MSEVPVLYLDGESLTPELLMDLSLGKYVMALSEEAWKKVEDGRAVVDEVVASGKVTYGINTGFGHFAKVTIPDDQLEELQYNLIRSHASGVGDFISYERSKRVMALRVNVLAKGNSGVSRESLERAIAAFNKGCIPCIPEKGTVGASGDLAPLAHLALGLMGEGKMWDPKTKTVGDAATILKENDLQPLRLKAKEGLAFINGTQFITALGCEALYRAERIAKQADIVTALTFEALRGTTAAYHPYIHEARKHSGQIEVARRLRSVLHSDMYPSDINENLRDKSKVQDSYTLRCVPQVHGICNDTIEFVRGILTTEMNSATDNPMIFKREGEEGFIISGGNFHGEYPAKALDYLAIGVHELANISERRIERLVNESLGGLPAFLVKKELGGLNSGFMIAHCCAASLVSENKVLTHPGSVDSIPTSSGQEDHVSMGGFCARKALQVVDNVEHVLAIELLAACQGLYLLSPHTTTEPLTAVYNLVRSVVPPYDKDRFMNPDIEACYDLLFNNKVWETVEPYMNKYFEAHKN